MRYDSENIVAFRGFLQMAANPEAYLSKTRLHPPIVPMCYGRAFLFS